MFCYHQTDYISTRSKGIRSAGDVSGETKLSIGGSLLDQEIKI